MDSRAFLIWNPFYGHLKNTGRKLQPVRLTMQINGKVYGELLEITVTQSACSGSRDNAVNGIRKSQGTTSGNDMKA